MLSTLAPIAVKAPPASPAAPSGSTAAAANSSADSNVDSTNASEPSKTGDFAALLLLQLGAGDAAPTASPVASTLAAAPLVVSKDTKDSKDSKTEDAISDPANGMAALFASLGIPLPPAANTSPDATSSLNNTQETATPVDSAANNPLAGLVSMPATIVTSDLSKLTKAPSNIVSLDTSRNSAPIVDNAPTVTTGKDSANLLTPATDTPTAKVAGFEELLAKAEVKPDSKLLSSQDATPTITATQAPSTPPAKTVEAQAHVATPVRDSHWAADFSQKVVWVASQEKQSAQLTLNPPNLGPLEVTINVSKDQTTAIFSSPHSEVRQAIESAMPQLREAFAAAGISLGQASVNSESFRQQQGNEAQQPGQNRGNRNDDTLADDGNEATTISTTPIKRNLSMVDTFA